MNYNNPLPSSINNIIKLTTIVLFALFSFIYLFCIQNDVLAEAQYVFSGGLTTYSRSITLQRHLSWLDVGMRSRFFLRLWFWQFSLVSIAL